MALAIASVQNSLSGAATFSKIIALGDPLPDAPGTVMNIRDPVLDEATAGSQMLVSLADSDGLLVPVTFQALYLVDSARNFRRIVSTATTKPGGGTFSSINAFTVYDGKVYFMAELAQMLCKVDQPGGPVTLIAAKGDLYAGTNRLDGFGLGGLSAYSGGVIFDGYVSWTNRPISYLDLFHYDGSSLTSMIGFGITAVPGKAGSFFYLNSPTAPVVRDGEVAFEGTGLPIVQGIYAFPIPGSGKTPRRIVDGTGKIPGSTQKFSFPGGTPVAFDIDGGEAAFYATSYGNTNRGFYRHTAAAGIVVAVNRDPPVPGAPGNFNALAFPNNVLCLSGGKMIFRGYDMNGAPGIYLHDGKTIEKIIATGDLIGGEQQFEFELTRDGFIGNQLLLLANTTLYRVTLGGSPPATVTLNIVKNGDLVEVSWDGAAAGPGAVLQFTASLTSPNWQPVTAQSNPFQVRPQSGVDQYYRLKL